MADAHATVRVTVQIEGRRMGMAQSRVKQLEQERAEAVMACDELAVALLDEKARSEDLLERRKAETARADSLYEEARTVGVQRDVARMERNALEEQLAKLKTEHAQLTDSWKGLAEEAAGLRGSVAVKSERLEEDRRNWRLVLCLVSAIAAFGWVMFFATILHDPAQEQPKTPEQEVCEQASAYYHDLNAAAYQNGDLATIREKARLVALMASQGCDVTR